MFKNKVIRIFTLILCALLMTSMCSSDSFARTKKEKKKKVKWVKSKWGIKMLMLMNKDQGQMKKQYAEEDKSYSMVKKAIEHDIFTEGYPSFEVKKKYGEPVVELFDADGSSKWVYKPQEATFFSGEKAYLFFAPEGELLGWKLIAAQKPKDEIFSEM